MSQHGASALDVVVAGFTVASTVAAGVTVWFARRSVQEASRLRDADRQDRLIRTCTAVVEQLASVPPGWKLDLLRARYVQFLLGQLPSMGETCDKFRGTVGGALSTIDSGAYGLMVTEIDVAMGRLIDPAPRPKPKSRRRWTFPR